MGAGAIGTIWTHPAMDRVLGAKMKVVVTEARGRHAKVAGDPDVRHGPPCLGDVRHSLADISAEMAALGFSPFASLDEGLGEYVAWARSEIGV